MHVRLTAKLAEAMEGVDLSTHTEGDVIELSESDASLLIRGGWAERVSTEERATGGPAWRPEIAADRARLPRPSATPRVR